MVNAALLRLNTGLSAKLNAGGVSVAPRIPLALIDEDPDQPRRHFDETALTQLAESIRMVGVLQPVGVQAAAGGRYLLRWGARRVRASALAGLADVPAVLVAEGQGDLVSQVVENAQHVFNTPLEIAAAVAAMDAREGVRKMSNEQIATACALHPQELKHYRALAEMRDVPCLAAAMDAGTSPRALYELWLAWQKQDDAGREHLAGLIAECPDLTLTAARRVKARVETVASEAPNVVQAETTPADTSPPSDAHTVAPEDAATAERPARHRSAAPPAPPSEDERESRVRAWLDLPKPRPRLTV